jgi:hypothetical protein
VDNLTHRATGRGHIFYHQHPFTRRKRKAAPQRHHAFLALAKEGTTLQGARHFLANDNTTHSRGDHRINSGITKALRNPPP